MKKIINETFIQGYLYDTDRLELKVSGENAKNPGTEFISGTIKVATDDDLTNVISIVYRYEAATTKSGKKNTKFDALKDIIDGKLKTVMNDGVENATKVRVNSAIGVNDFPITNSNGEKEWIAAKKNDGGFIHVINAFDREEKDRNTFRCDMIITGTRYVEADEERNLPAKLVVKGCTFNFFKALVPVEFSVINPNAISYFEGLEATGTDPAFTEVRGRQVSETVVKKIEEESAFGESIIRESKSTRKDWVITWAAREPYVWDTEETITAEELKQAIADREVFLANEKKRREEYEASLNATPVVDKGSFNF